MLQPSSHLRPTRSFQDLILTLEEYWAAQGCVVLQPYDIEMGAGTFHPATTLRALGPKPWRAAYVQPSRRPKDGRYGENPNRLQHYYQFQVIMKPSPPDLQKLYLDSLRAIGLDMALHDVRFVEDDWESPTLGAWGLGWECWCDGMEVSQFTYFQQVAGFECAPVSGELTYGLERLAMYVQGVENVYDLNFNGLEGHEKVTYGDIFLQAEQEYSRYNFEYADTEMIKRHFEDAEGECRRLLDLGKQETRSGPRVSPEASPRTSSAATGKQESGKRHLLALPAYDQCIKASHCFNLLDARGVIAVTERQSYILRVRELAKACGAAWLDEGRRRVIRFDHLNIRVTDQEAARDFITAVVGLKVGPRPPFDFHGHWLYLGDVPVIHLAPRDRPGEVGWVNHIAFSGYDFERKTAELKAAGFEFHTQHLPDSDIRQIFLRGPEGIRIELQCPPAGIT